MTHPVIVPTQEALTPEAQASNTDADQYVAEHVGVTIAIDGDGNKFEVPVLELRLKDKTC